MLGDRRTRVLYPALVVAAFVAAARCRAGRPGALLALLAAPLAIAPVRPSAPAAPAATWCPVLAGTGKLQLAYGVLLAVGLAISG